MREVEAIQVPSALRPVCRLNAKGVDARTTDVAAQRRSRLHSTSSWAPSAVGLSRRLSKTEMGMTTMQDEVKKLVEVLKEVAKMNTSTASQSSGD